MFRRALDRLARRLKAAWPALAAIVILLAGSVGYWQWRAHNAQLERRLMAASTTEVSSHPDLVKYAARIAKPVFADECASCHGADMTGGKMIGAPSLVDHVTLYEDTVFHIERTILYGVRTGQSKANDITAMPAYGQRGQLTKPDIEHVVAFMQQLSNLPHDQEAAALGREVYAGRAACYDCHGGDGKGLTEYGAPDLTANVWDYGGDPKSLYDSVYFGRHGIMPAWIGKLTLTQIRALAVYVHASRKP